MYTELPDIRSMSTEKPQQPVKADPPSPPDKASEETDYTEIAMSIGAAMAILGTCICQVAQMFRK